MNIQISLSPATLDGSTAETVNARDLHAFLRVKTAFKDWIARRITDYCFCDGKDFCSFLSESSGGRPRIEYALSLSMAKELCMVENNEQGQIARRHFIDCEKRAKQAQRPIPAQPSENLARFGQVAIQYADKALPNLSERSRHALLAGITNRVFEAEILSLPSVEGQWWMTSDLAKELGLSHITLGKKVSAANLKTPEYGELRLGQGLHSAKQVEVWYWNEKGKDAVFNLLNHR